MEPNTKANREKVRIYFLWGQSHMVGGRSVQDLTGPGHDWAEVDPLLPYPYPAVKDVFIYDKYMRGRTAYSSDGKPNYAESRASYKYFESVDKTGTSTGCSQGRLPEGFSFRALTAGYAGAAKSDVTAADPNNHFGPTCQKAGWYPWEMNTQANVSEPLFGPEMSFGTEVQESTDEIILIVKFAVGGTSVLDHDCAHVINWNTGSTFHGGSPGLPDHGGSYMDTFLEDYIRGALVEAATEYPVSDYQIFVGGVISLIGSNDALRGQAICQPPLNLEVAHREAYTDAIQAIRDQAVSTSTLTGPQAPSPKDVPYLLLNSPTVDGMQVSGYYTRLDQVQNAQLSLDSTHPQTGLENVTVLKTTAALDLDAKHAHTDAQGNVDLGQLMAAWAVSAQPLAIN